MYRLTIWLESVDAPMLLEKVYEVEVTAYVAAHSQAKEVLAKACKDVGLEVHSV